MLQCASTNTAAMLFKPEFLAAGGAVSAMSFHCLPAHRHGILLLLLLLLAQTAALLFKPEFLAAGGAE
jgi:hypothetical protein